MAGEYAFGPNDQLPLGFFVRYTPAQRDMKKCLDSLPDDLRAMLIRDAQRAGFILGRDLLQAEQEAARRKRSAGDDEEEVEYAELRGEKSGLEPDKELS